MAVLFPRLVEAAEEAWRAYTQHQFVLRLAAGDLPEACFRRYLVQDYLFLLHFARAWGLAVYKSDALSEMRRAQRLVAATLDVEIGLHIDYCRSWGLSETALAAEPEAAATIAYTRFVLDRGLTGDRLDLEPTPQLEVCGGAFKVPDGLSGQLAGLGDRRGHDQCAGCQRVRPQHVHIHAVADGTDHRRVPHACDGEE